MSDASSRRDFLLSSGGFVSGAWLALNLPAIEAAAAYARRAMARGGPFEVLTPEEAKELEAIAEQVIPNDDTPGARDAGVVYFMDRALGSFSQDLLAAVRAGLPDLQKAAKAKQADVPIFSALSFEHQTAVLRGMDQTPFFGAVRFLTVAGMFANPSYGGNKDWAGWRLIGHDGAHAHQPPFGYYDANYHKP